MGAIAFDAETAHAHFSKACFNAAWTLIEKTDRTPAEAEEMIRLNQASLWHWTQRPDCTDRNLSIGYWQASRIRAVLGHGAEASRYAALSLAHSASLQPFYQACAHEARARAAFVEGDPTRGAAEAMQVRALLQGIADPEERDIVLADLATLPLP